MPSKKPSKKIKPPKGTRDLYPEDLLRQRYITNAWRDASIRCGFEEIAGPTFESTELYSVKSGDGILNELFQTFSGKSDKEIEQVQKTGQAPFALRPEFTPTLARMYAAHAKQLPKPCKWFTAGPYFRAERPQRGRLREFLQWNCDIIGLPSETGDTVLGSAVINSELLAVNYELCSSLGLSNSDVRIKMSFRPIIAALLKFVGVQEQNLDEAFMILDRRGKLPSDKFAQLANELGLNIKLFDFHIQSQSDSIAEGMTTFSAYTDQEDLLVDADEAYGTLLNTKSANFDSWVDMDMSIVRGLAYYTGMVFELIADGERAVAGGGRYDNLIELFGGPPTPACGFGMGDVVLGNLLDDKELMPTGVELLEAVARPQASIRPDAFIVPNGDPANEPLVHTLAANLRRGIESESWLADKNRKPWQTNRYSVPPLHARISYKSTRKINKLKADASDQHAKFFVEIHADNKVELTNMDTREPITSPIGSFHVDPSHEHYIGQAIANLL